MSVYTKTGDKGMTSLVGGQRVSKCCDRLESYGSVDELNSNIGVLITYCSNETDVCFLTNIQNELFVIGGALATDTTQGDACSALVVSSDMISSIEREIDRIQALLPALKYFVLPGGTRASAYAHVCRTVCRRVERCILRLVACETPVDENIIAYINRLSDYFFVLARKLNADNGVADVAWTPNK